MKVLHPEDRHAGCLTTYGEGRCYDPKKGYGKIVLEARNEICAAHPENLNDTRFIPIKDVKLIWRIKHY